MEIKVNKLYNENCIKTLKRMPNNYLGSIVTDPPYGIKFMNSNWDYQVPSVGIWKRCFRKVKPGGYLLVACGTRTQHRMAMNIEEAGFEILDIIVWAYGEGFPKGSDIGKVIKEKTGDDLWEGWNTGLKPAVELWTLARKPIEESSIYENVIKWGVGALNIGGCRIKLKQGESYNLTDKGRFPANLIHDGSEEVVSKFPYTKSGKLKSYHKRNTEESPNGIYGKFNKDYDWEDTYGDEGSASRFFYCAKVSSKERDEGLDTLDTIKGGVYKFNSPKEKEVWHTVKRKNHHPTVKPIQLMRYLVKLVTPPNEVCYDPFSGSGSTLIGCMYENINYIGSEISEPYVEIAKKRLKFYRKIQKETLF